MWRTIGIQQALLFEVLNSFSGISSLPPNQSLRQHTATIKAIMPERIKVIIETITYIEPYKHQINATDQKPACSSERYHQQLLLLRAALCPAASSTPGVSAAAAAASPARPCWPSAPAAAGVIAASKFLALPAAAASAAAAAAAATAGLFGCCKLHENIEAGIMKQKDVPLYLENGEIKSIFPYLVGDAAFPLGVLMMKAIVPTPAAGTSEVENNARILLARHVIERAFGRLKGRWLFCKHNA
jgi:hypothetical protein